MFSISDFIHINRAYFIWAVFAALLYVFRDMFALVFITYIMCFITASVSHWLHSRYRWNRRFAVVLIYLVFLVMVGAFLVLMPPRLLAEAISFTEQLPNSLRTLNGWVEANLSDNELLAPMLDHVKSAVTAEAFVINAWNITRGVLEKGLHYGSWFFIAMLFSFLIMLDLPRLSRSLRHLRFTRLAEAYHETAASIALFATVVGENFRAQLMISAVNTLLTAIGLYVLNVNGAALLCTLVFICGLIPVLGVFISSVPVVLMAINSGGIELGLWAVAMIIVIHLIEAYILNPRIVSSVMHINPVMTLIILYIAHYVMGMWGMLLGIPIAVYFYRKISEYGRKSDEVIPLVTSERRRPRAKRRPMKARLRRRLVSVAKHAPAPRRLFGFLRKKGN